MELSIYLLKQSVQQFDEALAQGKNPKLIGEGQEAEYSYQIYLIKGEPKKPDWVSFIDDHVNADELAGVENQTYSVLILLRVTTPDGDRVFAAPFGHARFHLSANVIEPKFGLITTLNSIDENRIKSVNSRILGTKTIQRREAANLDSAMTEFTFGSIQNCSG